MREAFTYHLRLIHDTRLTGGELNFNPPYPFPPPFLSEIIKELERGSSEYEDIYLNSAYCNNIGSCIWASSILPLSFLVSKKYRLFFIKKKSYVMLFQKHKRRSIQFLWKGDMLKLDWPGYNRCYRTFIMYFLFSQIKVREEHLIKPIETTICTFVYSCI